MSWNIGGNDMLYCLTRAKAGLGGGKDNQNCYRETLESFKNNWTSIIEEIKSLVSPSCKLITMTNYTSFENWDENAQIMRIYGLKANEFIKVESEKEGIYVADAADYMNGLELDHPAENLLFMDRVHPNEDGHIKIFESLKSLNI